MGLWPGNPVAWMSVSNFSGGTDSTGQFRNGIPNSQTVTDVDITWIIHIDYDDHPIFDHGRGFFRAELYEFTDAGDWFVLEAVQRLLGNDDDDGHWSDDLTLETTMIREIQVYRIDLYCGTRDTSLGTSVGPISQTFTAIQGSANVGSFTLDFQPISIIYCPPDQDMTASLTQSLQYGTRFTIGTSQGFRTQTSVGGQIDFLGVQVGGVNATDSRSIDNRTETGIEVSYFRNTVLTADNQRAIGRAYWGPLGDIFVIAVNPRFAVSRRADGTLFYTTTDIDQLIVVPAYKLLRPSNDLAISQIPADVRRRVLELDPFITNLEQFFPDSGIPLTTAANPHADPSANNRAELLGRWWLNNATELNYSIGESKQLKTGETTEVQFESTVTLDVGFGVNLFNLIGISVTGGNSFTTRIGLQSSKETIATTSRTAACYLIRNQNEKDLDAIEVYYDKVFSTLMFRKIQPGKPGQACFSGKVKGLAGEYLAKLTVTLVGADGFSLKTMTDQTGRYSFPHMDPGNYTIIAGDRPFQIEVPHSGGGSIPCINVDFREVRRPIDLQKSTAWEVELAFAASSEAVWRLSHHLDGVFDEADLAYVFGASENQTKATTNRLVVSWPRTPLERLGGISREEVLRLEGAGVLSMQELWRKGQNSQDLQTLAQKTDIPLKRLRDWVSSADRMRVSRTKEGGPPPPPKPQGKGCLIVLLSLIILLLSLIRWRWLRRQLRRLRSSFQ